MLHYLTTLAKIADHLIPHQCLLSVLKKLLDLTSYNMIVLGFIASPFTRALCPVLWLIFLHGLFENWPVFFSFVEHIALQSKFTFQICSQPVCQVFIMSTLLLNLGWCSISHTMPQGRIKTSQKSSRKHVLHWLAMDEDQLKMLLLFIRWCLDEASNFYSAMKKNYLILYDTMLFFLISW